ncbi:aldehyde dehydrogenase [Naegleria gruberi]|uniref:Aldehyde dehydrogenase n=1 Tax=Naegleria gruberi TaxID=5762 RepID=D2VIL4_NAEGR|nr:aldehyde dehydrogenase [Naegleria gruberi]EFC43376.1 aldehyde dehydrogenase [Naegleria gruberi]|eukprot:XP_002676120.1 aldehyde dehydrogenase [Naegleria gruberi strain NEG-M]
MEPQKRQELIYKLADEWDRQVEEMALLEGLNNGTPIGVNRYVIKSITDTWRYSAGWIDKLSGRICVTDKKFHVYTQRSPVGVVGVISPWNFPMWCSLVNVAPAMAMGNCVILKPSEQTPLTALKLADICQKVGIPKGVYNVVMGDGPNAGAPLVSHKKVSKIAFTGSTEVGRLVMKGAAESNLKQVHLELGGKSPVVVCPDVNVDEAVKVAAFSIFNNNGEACTAGSRTFVHADIYDEFVRKLKEHVATFKIGYNLNDETNIGPLVDKEQYDRVKSYIEIGKKEGAKLLIGGDSEGLPTKGYFVKPTIFYDVDDNMRIAREEIFGPVQSILKPWKTLDEVITRCNNTEFGLAAAILTKNVDNMFTFSDRIKCGVCWINNYHNVLHVAEFGGVKQSGFGREAGEEGMKAWTSLKTVILQLQSNL